MTHVLLIMLLLGFGMGLVMQVLVIAVQNAVDYADLGVATSGSTLFRLIGGSLGTAILGAIFASRLSANLAHLLPAMANGAGAHGGSAMNAATIAQLPPAAQAAYRAAFSASLDTTFLVATVIAIVGFVLTWLVPEKPLRETVAATASDVGIEAGETFPMPTGDDTAEQLVRGLSVIANRDVQRGYIESIVRRAGLDLGPAAAWLLIELGRDDTIDPVALGHAHRVPPDTMYAAVAELTTRALVATPTEERRGARYDVTPAGCEVLEQLVVARRAHLAELFPSVPSERHDELARLLRGLARELVPDAPHARHAEPRAARSS
jgi:DNA-binding MarR family transcriptional regulator